MSVLFQELISLPPFESIQLLTGTSGLSNPVSGIGILDYEYAENMENQFRPGDLVISSFLFAKGREDLLFSSVRKLLQEGVSALGIKNIYFKSLSPEILSFARSRGFPIFLFDQRIMFEEIVSAVCSTVQFSEIQRRLSDGLDRMLSPVPGPSLELVQELFARPGEYFFCLFLRDAEASSLFRAAERLSRGPSPAPSMRALVYRGGLLVVFTFSSPPPQGSACRFEGFCQDEGLRPLHAGTSRPSLQDLGQAVREALWACRLSELQGTPVCFFENSGIYQLLLPLAETPWARSYCSGILDLLAEHDRKYQSELCSTARSYVENRCSVRQTALALFQHENTIRYRLAKMRQVLGMEKEPGRLDLELTLAFLLNGLLPL